MQETVESRHNMNNAAIKNRGSCISVKGMGASGRKAKN